MKKIVFLTLLVILTVGVLCISAAATAQEAASAGIYGAESLKTGITLTPEKEASTVLVKGEEVTDFHAEAEKVSVSYSGAVTGKQYLILVLNTETDAPTEENIVYIDQAGATSSGVSFTAYPSALSEGEYFVYISSNASSGVGSDGLEQVGSFRYHVAYTRGDVDDNGKIEPKDATLILQYYVANEVDKEGIISTGLFGAADIDRNNKVEPRDATYILQYYVANAVDKPNIFPN